MEPHPTKVVGHRVAAYVIDWLVLAVVAFGLFLLLTKSYPKSGFKNGIVLGNTRHAFESGSANRTWWIVGIAVVAILLFIVIQGLRGWTPGKALLGIRLVGREGRPPGILRTLVREILWIVDGLPGLPLVGFVVALVSRANQRVGDLAAGTYVVRRAAVGQPIGQLVPEVAGFPPGSQPTVEPAGATGAPPGAETAAAAGGPGPEAAPQGGTQGEGGPGQPAGWYGDPRGEKRLRYWDGSTWTDHTAD